MSHTQDLDQLLQSFVDRGLPGCGLQVMQHGEVLYEGYAGYSDLDTKAPVTKDSVFRLASMSKIPLYTALLMLYERGHFLLQDPISNFLPEYKEMKKFVRRPNGYFAAVPAENPITISDVLSMKCGLPYCNSKAPTDNLTLASMQECMQPLWEKGYYTNREHVQAMSKAVLAAEPGTTWIYGFSSELACAVIEAVCGKGVDEVFEELLFEPLEMKTTRSRYFGDIESRMVKLYAKRDGALVPGPTFFDDKHLPGPEHEQGWARLFSNVEDFGKLMSMLACGGIYKGRRIMSSHTIDMMRSNGLPELFRDPYNAGYGYGYGVRTLVDPEKGNHNGSIGAFGWTGGFGTYCEADPTEGLSIVYMHNMVPNEEYYHHMRVRTAAYGLVR